MKYSIIIPTYNHCDDLLKPCLESIIKFTDLTDAEVIVVANGCKDNTKEYVRSLPTSFKLLWFDEGLGFVKATNEGIKVAKGNFIILLNNDTILLPQGVNDWVRMLESPFAEPKVGLSGPMRQPSPETGRHFLIFFCVMIHRSVVEKVGLLDEIFSPGFGDDMDYCIRAEQAGFEIACCETNAKFENGIQIGNFPIYHKAEGTFDHYDGWVAITQRNRRILRERYAGNASKPLVVENSINISKALAIEGWMFEPELIWLAKQATQHSCIVEIGSFYGRSTRALADHTNGKIYTIDDFAGPRIEPEKVLPKMKGQEAILEFSKNLGDHLKSGKVTLLRMTSVEAAKWCREIGLQPDMIFIDGDHSYEAVRQDIEAWKPLLQKGGLLCGHDAQYPPVQQALASMKTEVVPNSSIWCEQKAANPKVYDTFMFFNEFDVLDIRLHELYDVVDKFVLIEGTHTHSGKPKPLYYKENQARFAKFADKIVHVIATLQPGPQGDAGLSWFNENNQRDLILNYLKDCRDEDIIIFSDVDEIPSKQSVQAYLANGREIMGFEQLYYTGYANCKRVKWTKLDVEGWTNGAKILPYSALKTITPSKIRYWPVPRLPNGGWHLSSLGGAEKVIEKIEAYAHQEWNLPQIKDKERVRQLMEAGLDVFTEEERYAFVPIDDSYPRYMLDNLDYFKKLGWFREFSDSNGLPTISTTNDLVSIIIPTMNHCEDLLKPCCEAIRANTDMSKVEVIVVANGCTDGTRDFVNSLGEPFKLIWMDQPSGFVTPVNAGIKASRGNYIVILNNDAHLLPHARHGWIEMLMKPFKDDPAVGATGPMIVRADCGLSGLMFFCVMIARKVIDKIGMLDEIFSPGGYDDHDFCERAKLAGFKLVETSSPEYKAETGYNTGSFPIFHTHSHTFGEVPNYRTEILQRNEQVLIDRYLKPPQKSPASGDFVSIIIPTMNHCDDLLKPCCEAIRANSDMSKVEVIVVANGCTDGTRDFVNSLGEPFKLIWMDEPSGFIIPVNAGIKASRGDYIVLLNNDAHLLPHARHGWIEMMMQPFKTDPAMGIVAPMFITVPFGLHNAMFFCVMIARKVIDKIGMLDEAFSPGGYDDHDFCERAKLAGFKMSEISHPHFSAGASTNVGSFPIYHNDNQTFGANPLYRTEILPRNERLILNRYVIGHPEVNDLERQYKQLCDTPWILYSDPPSDINRHLPMLHQFALECPRIVEFGTRSGSSTTAFLATYPRLLYCYDIEHSPKTVERLKSLRYSVFTDLQFITHDSKTADIPECDLLFIDSLHTGAQVAAELLHAGKVRKYIAFHDVTYFGLKGEDQTEGLLPSILDFLIEHSEWRIKYFTRLDTGLLVLERIGETAVRPQKVYDCFMFNKELDLLDLRLAELNDVVDKFVLVEMPATHSNRPKPLYFEENKQRFAQYLDKIIHVVVRDYPNKDKDGKWNMEIVREGWQRDAIMRGLKQCAPNDIVLISDIDELPSPKAIKNYRVSEGVRALEQKLYYYNCNTQCRSKWLRARIMPYETLLRAKPTAIREAEFPSISDGGWHFSYFGGEQEIIDKLESYSHKEFNTPEYKDPARIRTAIQNGTDLFVRNDHLEFDKVVIDESFPRYVVRNFRRLKQMGWIVEQPFMTFECRGKPVELYLPNPDWITNMIQYTQKFYEAPLLEYIANTYPKQKTIVDVGANLGNHARFFQMFLNYDCLVCLEPAVQNLPYLYKNVDPQKTVFLEKAAGSKPGWVGLKQEGPLNCGTYITIPGKDVECITIDSLNLPEVTLLKVDVEWNEVDVLQGAEKTIRRCHPVIFAEALSKEALGALLCFLTPLGYRQGNYFMDSGDKTGTPTYEFIPTGNSDGEVTAPVEIKDAPVLVKGDVTAVVSTKDRFFTTLPMAIASVATQTVRPKKLLIFDDSEKHQDLREVAPYDQLFRLLDAKGIEWAVVFGRGIGQVANHQAALESATTEFVWRLDDDNVAEPDALAGLLGAMKADVGAVGGLVLHPPHVMFLSKGVSNKIEDIFDGRNAQWFHHPKRELMEVDHLYSTFLYRRSAGIKAGGYSKELSPVGHREETMFTYGIKRAGYQVLINPLAVTWHLKATAGGIRGYQPQNWAADEQVFLRFLDKYGVHPRQTKWIVLDNGLGDHLMFKQILPEIKKKYANDRLVFAVCYPEVFEGDDLNLISIGEAMATLGTNLDQYNIYKWCIDHQWKTSMVDAFRRMYL